MRTLIAIALATALVLQVEATEPVNPLGDYQLLSQPGDPQPQYVVYAAAGIVIVTIYVGSVAVRAIVRLMDNANSNRCYWSNYYLTNMSISLTVPATPDRMCAFVSRPLVIQQRNGITKDCYWANLASVYFTTYYSIGVGYFCDGVAVSSSGARTCITVPLSGDGGSASLDFGSAPAVVATKTEMEPIRLFRAYQ